MASVPREPDTSFKPLAGKFAHICPFADNALIDVHDDRITKCICYWTREFLDAQDRKAIEIDARR